MTQSWLVVLVASCLTIGQQVRGEDSEIPAQPTLRDADYDAAIEFFVKRIERNPKGSLNYVHLARRYMKKGREAGDESCYAKAENALREALRQSPGDETIKLELAGVLCTRHRFAEGLQIAEDILKTTPGKQEALILSFDAQLELGRL